SIGLWMRLYGVNAFIFPSARNDVHVTVRNGQIEQFWGWNVVYYEGAPAPPNTFQRSVSFSDGKKIAPTDGISSDADGSAYDGSFEVTGVLSRRKKNYAEAVEKFYDRRFTLHPMGMDIPASLSFIRSQLDLGAIVATTGVSTDDKQLPEFCFSSVDQL